MTAVLVVLSWFVLLPHRWRLGVLYAALALVTYGTLYLSIGAKPSEYTPAFMLAWNLEGWRLEAFAINGGMLALLIGACLLGWRGAHHLLRRLTIVLLAVYLPLWAVFAAWQEVRLLMPLLILLLPMMRQPLRTQ